MGLIISAKNSLKNIVKQWILKSHGRLKNKYDSIKLQA